MGFLGRSNTLYIRTTWAIGNLFYFLKLPCINGCFFFQHFTDFPLAAYIYFVFAPSTFQFFIYVLALPCFYRVIYYDHFYVGSQKWQRLFCEYLPKLELSAYGMIIFTFSLLLVIHIHTAYTNPLVFRFVVFRYLCICLFVRFLLIGSALISFASYLTPSQTLDEGKLLKCLLKVSQKVS